MTPADLDARLTEAFGPSDPATEALIAAAQLQRLDSYVVARIEKIENGCWIWSAGTDSHGYGRYGRRGPNRNRSVHLVIYELLRGEVEPGFQLDHLCHSRDSSCHGGHKCSHRRCVNPAHLEPVSPQTNTWRGRGLPGENARKLRCKRGHEFSAENTYFWPGTTHSRPARICRTCRRDRKRGGVSR